MKLAYKSTGYKIRSVLRYWWATLYYRGKFRCGERSMVGERCGIHILAGGSISCAGRIILDDDVMLFAKGDIRIGRQFCLNRYSRIVAHESIEIGDEVTIGQNVAILDHDHQYSLAEGQLELDGYTTAPIHIGSHVWIGDKCTILKGVTIGDNVVIGAHTLVHKDVPAGVVIGGSPFRIIKYLDKEAEKPDNPYGQADSLN